jgi:integral membrane sensor domain MASE1
MKNGLIFIVIVALVAAVPLMTIWSINVLFGMGIPYNLSTWASSWWLGFIFGGGAYMVGKNS